MSFKNFLDLRKKTQPHIKIVERVILQKRSLKSDIFLALSVIFVASGIIWGISKADDIASSFTKPQIKNFSASGIVLNVDEVNLYIDQAKGSDDLGRTNYVFSLLDGPKIETDQYVSISARDIKLGAKVVVQGKIDGGNITVKRIIYFGIVTPENVTATSTKEFATSTATTSESVIPVDAGIQSEDSNSTSSPSIIETAKDVVANIVDLIIGTTSTSSSVASNDLENQIKESEPGFPEVPENDNSSTTTNNSNTEDATTTNTIVETVSDTISNTIANVSDVVSNVIDNIVEIVTGTPADNLGAQNENNETLISTPPTSSESPAE